MLSPFASNLRIKREELKLSQQQLANSLRIPVKNYRNYERGFTEPKLSIVVDMAKKLQTTTDYLLKNTIPKNLAQVNNSS